MSQLQVTGEAKIRDLQGPVVANSGVVTALDGAASQYVRGDGTLADFPTQTGGGSSVSYYLNGSVNQGTFGGSTYYQMSKNAITGTGTNFSTSADGLLAQFITDANDPDATSIPSGNWNIEFFMNVSASSGALASFYVEFYKYNGTTFTLVATNVATPEVLTGTTTIDAYYTSVAFPETALLQTDRLAIRIYANVASKTVTLYTEDNRLCQVVTTFSRGILSLNNLTDQQQYFAVGTSGSDFNIVSSLDTHTFNIPTASATKRGLLSTTDWSTFNNKVPYTGATGPVNLGIYGLSTSGISSTGESIFYASNLFQKSGLTEPAIAGYITEYFPISGNGVAYLDGDTSTSAILTFDTTGTRTYTFPNITGTLALLEGNQTFLGDKTFDGISNFNTTIFNSLQNNFNYGFQVAKQNTRSTQAGYMTITSVAGTASTLRISDGDSSTNNIFTFDTTGSRTYTFPNITGTIALLQGNQNFIGFKQFSDTNSTWLDYGISMAKGSTPSSLSSSRVNVYSNSGDKNLVIADTFASFAKLQFQATGDLTYTFPSSSGTIALTSNLSSYVPYTGATTNVNLGFNLLTTNSINLDGNSASGVLNIKSNSSISTSGAGYVSLVSGNVNQLSFVFNGGNSATFTSVSLSASRTYSLPDASGTISLTSDLSAYVTLATSQTISGQKTFSAQTNFAAKINALNNQGIGFYNVGSTLETTLYPAIGLSASRTIYLPNASGTIALTSDLSSYLPLTGGTLTGALSGTSATFSGTITSGTGSGNTLSSGSIDVGKDIGLAATQGIVVNNARVLAFASTGAATFSSSVEIGQSATVRGFTGTTGAGMFMAYGSAGAGVGSIYSYNYGTSTYGGTILDGSYVAFYNSGSERMRITGGNVGIGTTSPSYQLQLSTDSAAKPTSALWTIASDERIKENINPYNKGLQELLKINPITYDYNGLGGFKKGKGGVGIIAQEIMNILPDSVSSIKAKLNEEDEAEIDILNFNGHELTYILINAIKEQQAQIEELSNKIVALESK